MTAQPNPDQHSYASESSSDSETYRQQQDFTYGDSNADEVPADYVPEREFVLMPLFRRIGELLGLRRNAADKYTETARPGKYVLETERIESAPKVPVTSAAISAREPTVVNAEVTEPEDLLGIEPLPSPVAMASPVAQIDQVSPVAYQDTEPEVVESTQSRNAEEEYVASLPVVEAEPLESPATYADESESSSAPELPQSQVESLAMAVEPALKAHPAAFLMGAAEKLTAAESEAPPRHVVVPEWESTNTAALRPAPALQQPLSQPPIETPAAVAPVTPAVRSSEPRPKLVPKPPSAPFWRRIDWSQQFAPKRVAIIGAVAMAILMIVGISLARHPAAEALPQQTRALEPGGVTLSTHPVPAPPSASRTVAETPHPQASRQHTRARYDDGPDVVTHYYGKPKPSPVHESNVGGVKHYSDMP